jgi:hypothetical protein
MPSYDEITDEEELHKLMTATEDFEERKKIRSRLREIRDKLREESDARRKQREAETEDLVKKKFERAQEEKKKKMELYKQQGPTHERESKYQEVAQGLVKDKFKAAEDEKAQKLAAYTKISTTKTGTDGQETTTTTTTSTTTQKTPGGQTRTVTQKTTESTSKGFGGTAYGKPTNKPQGAKDVLTVFQKMDDSNTNSTAKPRALARSPSAIKDMLLSWTKAMTAGYPGVEVTNFSSSWNNGLAFCALIHHFFPNAFDFSKLDPQKRRYNFTLAFETAEKEANISPLLDVEDMVKMKNPDWKCVFTYVQSLYRHLRDRDNGKATSAEQ